MSGEAAAPGGFDERDIGDLLARHARGEVTTAEALQRLRDLPFADLGFARVDHHRRLRRGFPEVIYGQGKTLEQVVALVNTIAATGAPVLVTRTNAEVADAVRIHHPGASFDGLARTLTVTRGDVPITGAGTVLVIAAGTSDLAVAQEAVRTSEVMGNRTELVADVGVAGIHRLLAVMPRLQAARVLVVIAGMEGALPSVVAGLVRIPIIAVPTSVGYGASFGGIAALLAMLNSCASGVTVVNIDNGFGAAFAASLINHLGVEPGI